MNIALESPDQPEVIALIAELDAYQDTLYAETGTRSTWRRWPGRRPVRRRCRRTRWKAVVQGHSSGVGPAFGELKPVRQRPAVPRPGRREAPHGLAGGRATERNCAWLMLKRAAPAGLQRCTAFRIPSGGRPVRPVRRRSAECVHAEAAVAGGWSSRRHGRDAEGERASSTPATARAGQWAGRSDSPRRQACAPARSGDALQEKHRASPCTGPPGVHRGAVRRDRLLLLGGLPLLILRHEGPLDARFVRGFFSTSTTGSPSGRRWGRRQLCAVGRFAFALGAATIALVAVLLRRRSVCHGAARRPSARPVRRARCSSSAACMPRPCSSSSFSWPCWSGTPPAVAVAVTRPA